MTDSERYKRDDAKCAARLKKQEADQLLPCRDPDEGEDDGGVGTAFRLRRVYDRWPPVFRWAARVWGFVARHRTKKPGHLTRGKKGTPPSPP